MCHPWLAAGLACFLIAQLVRELTPVLRAPHRDRAPSAAGLLGSRLPVWLRGRLSPVADVLLAMGWTANAVTACQLLASALCAVAYARDWMFTAGWLLVTCGTLDVLDGEMARRHTSAGPRGAFADSVVDRYAESVVFAGLAVLYRDEWVLWAVLAAFTGAFMVSYTRARAEALGAECRIGLLQRPERYVLLGGGSMFGALAYHLTCGSVPEHALLTASIVAVAILANVTGVQRALFAMRQLA